MKRACKITLKYATDRKKRVIHTLLQAYRAAINFYIKSLWNNPGKLDKDTLARLQNNRLSERYKSNALKQALETVTSTRKAAKVLGKPCSMPVYKGYAILDGKFVSVETGRKSFDLVLRLSSLKKGSRITIPTRKTKIINKWFSRPGAKFIQGACISERSIFIWVESLDTPVKTDGSVIGIDIGLNKLITDSVGRFFGTSFRTIRDKIIHRKPGSKGHKKAYQERFNYINRILNLMPWTEIKTIGIEDLKYLKHGKKRDRGKSFRRAMAPWAYRQVLNRIQAKAQENRVRLVPVPPANTSRCCPSCRVVSKNSRTGENFRCVACGYEQDADIVGALNVLDRTIRLMGNVEFPMHDT